VNASPVVAASITSSASCSRRRGSSWSANWAADGPALMHGHPGGELDVDRGGVEDEGHLRDAAASDGDLRRLHPGHRGAVDGDGGRVTEGRAHGDLGEAHQHGRSVSSGRHVPDGTTSKENPSSASAASCAACSRSRVARAMSTVARLEPSMLMSSD
jgi:hypothetical protein